MSSVRRFLLEALRQVSGALGSFLLWVLWALLAAALALQVYIASRNELAVPSFVLRRLESQLARNGIKMTFAHAMFDPTGRILVESPRVFLPGLEEPVLTARAAYLGLNPWGMLVGQFAPREVRLVEGTALIPSLLSPSGRPEPIVNDVDAVVLIGGRQLVVRQITGRLGNLLVSVHGEMARGGPSGRPSGQLLMMTGSRFAELCRIAIEVSGRLNTFDEPSLDLALTPSPSRGAFVSAHFFARGLKLATPVAVQLSGLQAAAEFPLLGDAVGTSVGVVKVEEAHLPGGIVAGQLAGSIEGRVMLSPLRFETHDVQLTARAVDSPDGGAQALSAVIRPKDNGRWTAQVVGRVVDSNLGVDVDADLKARTAEVSLAGTVAPAVLDAISAHVRVDVRQFFDFRTVQLARAHATFGPGWKFEHATAQAHVSGIDAYGVPMQEGYASIEVDPRRLYAPDAWVRIGDNFARGSYEHVFATREFRFLLEGRLRPLDISRWFQSWWPEFFDRFGFPVAPPEASVDVRGIWKEGRQTQVFVFADAASPVINGQKLARVRTRIFIRPGFYDGLELMAQDLNGGTALGTFAVSTNMNAGLWRSIDVDANSTVALPVAAGLGGDVLAPFLSPFELAQSPTVKLQLHLDGPDRDVRHNRMDLAARSTGGFKYEHLPFEDVAFTALLRDDDLVVDAPQAKFAGGAVRLHAKVGTATKDRRVVFDASVTDASLGVAVNAFQHFAAERKGLPPPPPGKFVQEKANVRADITASGEGLYGDALSYHGAGKATLRGAEIGEVPLFGPLSALLKFTALRFTTAAATFKINGPKLEFPEVTLRGANSAIDAHGEYALDRRQLDFRAKVFPFQESGSVIKTVVGAVLTPISNALEVKLTGTLEKPDWAFVIGPTNLLRSLAPGAPETTTADAGGPAAKPAPPAEAGAAKPATPATSEPPAAAGGKTPKTN